MTHFWPDHTALIATLRAYANMVLTDPDDAEAMQSAADALEEAARLASDWERRAQTPLPKLPLSEADIRARDNGGPEYLAKLIDTALAAHAYKAALATERAARIDAEQQAAKELGELKRERDDAQVLRVRNLEDRLDRLPNMSAFIQEEYAILIEEEIAIAAKERAEAERDIAEEEASKLWKALFWLDHHEPELTAAADEKFGLDMMGHLLSHPTTEPAKAEES